MNAINLNPRRDAVEHTLWAMTRDCAALQRLANEAGCFFPGEVAELRQMAHGLLDLALQAETRIKVGTK